MTTGIISYLSPRGLGTMAHDLRVQLGIEHQMVIPDAGWSNVPEWATGQEFYLQKWDVELEDLAAWKEVYGIDHIVCIETGFGDRTFEFAKSLGMKTSLICMWENFHPRNRAYQNVDRYLCPAFVCYQEVPFDSKQFLPWPVDTHEFQFRQRNGPAKHFVINGGSGGMNGRKGVLESIQGFLLASPQDFGIRLTVRSQVPLESILPSAMMEIIQPEVEKGIITIAGHTLQRADQYIEGDVLLYCSHYDGHSLVGIEAMASGMVVVTTNAAPMNEMFRSRNLLVKVAERQKAGTVNPHCYSNIVDINDLADKIRWCASNDVSMISAENRRQIEREHSWEKLKGGWASALEMLTPKTSTSCQQ